MCTIVTFTINEISDSTSNALTRSLLKKSVWVKISQNNFKIAKVKIDNREYFMVVNTSLAGNMYDETNVNTINIFDNKDSITNNEIHKSDKYYVGDTVFLNNKFFSIKNITDNYEAILLHELPGNEKVVGYKQGFYIPDFIGTKLNEETVSYSSLLKNHYIVLDFWGTWCEPCIALIPEMKKVYAALQLNLADSIKFVSVAYDQKTDLDKLKRIIQENALNWLHFYDDRDIYLTNNNSLVKLFHISCYPGYILINPDGKILFTGCGKEALDQISNILTRSR